MDSPVLLDSIRTALFYSTLYGQPCFTRLYTALFYSPVLLDYGLYSASADSPVLLDSICITALFYSTLYLLNSPVLLDSI